MIKVVITKPGFTWTLLIGATNGLIKTTVKVTFASKNDLLILHTELTNDMSARLYCPLVVNSATIRSLDLRVLHHRVT